MDEMKVFTDEIHRLAEMAVEAYERRGGGAHVVLEPIIHNIVSEVLVAERRSLGADDRFILEGIIFETAVDMLVYRDLED